MEKKALWLMQWIAFIGFTIILLDWHSIRFADSIGSHSSITLFVLFCLLFIVESFPIPLWGGFSSLSFPIIYVLYLNYGSATAALLMACIVGIVNWLYLRPARAILFNMGIFILSIYAGKAFVVLGSIYFDVETLGFTWSWLKLSLFLIGFFVINNLLIDAIFLVRPEPYTWLRWWKKTKLEGASASFAFAYCGLMLFLFHMGKKGDVWSYTFFFIPLAAISVITHIITRLRRAKEKLETLVEASNLMSRKWDNIDVVFDQAMASLSKMMDYTYAIIFLKREDVLVPEKVSGHTDSCPHIPSLLLNEGVTGWAALNNEPLFVSNVQTDPRFSKMSFIHDHVKSMMAVPLFVDGELLGVFTVAKGRTYGFQKEDLHFLSVLANHTAVTLRNSQLFEEKRNRVLLEERNRIAREIHDGIAQSLAGVVMQMDSSLRIFDAKPDQVKKVLEDSLLRLRRSLKEVRQSIFALRPQPQEQIGLITALEHRVNELSATGLDSQFHVKGLVYKLSKMTEEIIYKICHESLNNVIKHSEASKIEVHLHYTSSSVLLMVRDNGVGFSLAEVMFQSREGKRYGLTSMNELAQRLEASLQIKSQEGGGTEIQLHIPWIEEKEGDEHSHASNE